MYLADKTPVQLAMPAALTLNVPIAVDVPFVSADVAM